MALLFSILIVIASLLLMGIVLIQNPKGGGIASNFMNSNTLVGVKKEQEVVEKATWGLAIGVMVLALLSNFFIDRSGTAETPSDNKSLIQEQIDNAPVTAPPAQGAPTAPAQ